MKKITLNVKGMHCKSCETLLKDEFSELQGVGKTEVDSKTGKVSVEYDETKVKLDMIKAKIKELGYEVG